MKKYLQFLCCFVCYSCHAFNGGENRYDWFNCRMKNSNHAQSVVYFSQHESNAAQECDLSSLGQWLWRTNPDAGQYTLNAVKQVFDKNENTWEMNL